ncbi:MAG: hypothetical protein ABR540_17060 [Acidimicrobiales bacterium]
MTDVSPPPMPAEEGSGHDGGPATPPGERRRKWRLGGKAVVPILIGLVSVTSALVTWRAVLLGSDATESDRRSVRETAVEEQIRIIVEARLQSDLRTYAAILEKIESSKSLTSRAAALAAEGRSVEASTAENDAKRLRSEAIELQRLQFLDFSAAVSGGGVDDLEFDAERRREELTLAEQTFVADRVNPDEAADEADALRRRSELLVLLLTTMVTAILFLTGAQVTNQRRLSTPLAGIGTAIWLSASILALGVST